MSWWTWGISSNVKVCERQGSTLPASTRSLSARGLVVVGEVRALEALLPHPEVAQVERPRCSRWCRRRSRPCRRCRRRRSTSGTVSSPGMLEDDARALRARRALPRSPRRRRARPSPIRRTPLSSFQCGSMPQWSNLLAVDAALGAELLAELDLVVARDDGDRDAARGRRRSGWPGSRGRRRRPRSARRRPACTRVRRPAVSMRYAVAPTSM